MGKQSQSGHRLALVLGIQRLPVFSAKEILVLQKIPLILQLMEKGFSGCKAQMAGLIIQGMVLSEFLWQGQGRC